MLKNGIDPFYLLDYLYINTNHMKLTLFLFITLCYSSLFASSISDKEESPGDSTLVMTKGADTIIVAQGKHIIVKTDGLKLRGDFRYATDSSIHVGDTIIELAAIDLIAKRKRGKTVGMIFANAPIVVVGFAAAGTGSAVGSEGAVIAGIGLMAVGTGLAIIESLHGKNYRAFTMKTSNTENPIRSWEYSVREE